MSIRSNRDWMYTPAETDDEELMERRRKIRRITAALCAVVAAVYFLIGARVVMVLDTPEYQPFGTVVGLAYVLGAFLLLAMDDRTVNAVGAFFQVALLFGYVDIARTRTPMFEIWGIAIWVVQVVILIALVYLEIRRPLPPPEKPIEDY
jgi:hypothetical protein